MKKVFLTFLVSLVFFLAASGVAQAQGLVPCGQGGPGAPRCELADIFTLVLNVYGFIVFYIAMPLAGLMIVVGGILMMISGGPGQTNPLTGIASPNLYNTAKNTLTGAIFGILLIWLSWLIVHSILLAIGYSGP